MANKWAIANGNWSDGSTWNDGVVPTADDDVWLNGFTVTIDSSIETKANTIRNIQGDGIQIGGHLNIPNSITQFIVISANFIGNIDLYLIQGQANNILTINGNVQNLFFYSTVNGSPHLIINGNADCLKLQNTSGGGSHSNDITINGNARKLYFISSRTITLNINGTIEVDSYLRVINWERASYFNLNGFIKFIGDYVMDEFNYITLIGQIDLSESTKTFPFVARNYITINSEITIINSIVPPQSVVLEGYQYGNKIGALKTFQGTLVDSATVINEATIVQSDNVAIVNLTEQQLQRVGNCATVSTVQKCFEEFKE